MSEVSIVGTVNYDRIILPDGTSHQGLGGILYNVLTLAPFLDEGDRLRPVARVGAERRRQVEVYAEAYPCIDLNGMLWDEGGTNETVLTYRTADDREEALVERAAPLTWKEIEKAVGADWVVVNMISGKEMDLDLFRRFSSASAGPLVLDVQSLTLTFKKGSDRDYKPIAKWKDWLAGAETVKGNEAEMRSMVGGEGKPFSGSLRELAKMCLAAGPETVIVTRGTAGHAIAWRHGKKLRYREVGVAVVPDGSLSDTTGCGDAFTSGYLLGRLRGESSFAASLLGASLASAACGTRGLEELALLKDPARYRKIDFATEMPRPGGDDKGEPL